MADCRHPELVSGSISPIPRHSPEWMLKQVQHDTAATKQTLSYSLALCEGAAMIFSHSTALAPFLRSARARERAHARDTANFANFRGLAA